MLLGRTLGVVNVARPKTSKDHLDLETFEAETATPAPVEAPVTEVPVPDPDPVAA